MILNNYLSVVFANVSRFVKFLLCSKKEEEK